MTSVLAIRVPRDRRNATAPRICLVLAEMNEVLNSDAPLRSSTYFPRYKINSKQEIADELLNAQTTLDIHFGGTL